MEIIYSVVIIIFLLLIKQLLKNIISSKKIMKVPYKPSCENFDKIYENNLTPIEHLIHAEFNDENIKTLKNINDPYAISELLKILNDNENILQNKAAYALFSIKDKDIEKKLKTYVLNKFKSLKNELKDIFKITSDKPKKTKELFDKFLKNPDISLIEILLKYKNKEYIEELFETVNDPKIDYIIESMIDNTNLEIRFTAASIILKKYPDIINEKFLTIINDCLKLLKLNNNNDFVDTVSSFIDTDEFIDRSLKDKSYFVKACAIEKLPIKNSHNNADFIYIAIKDKEAYVRSRAVLAAARTNNNEIIDTVLKISFNDSNEEVIYNAIKVAEITKNTKFIEKIENLCYHSNDYLKIAANKAIKVLKTK